MLLHAQQQVRKNAGWLSAKVLSNVRWVIVMVNDAKLVENQALTLTNYVIHKKPAKPYGHPGVYRFVTIDE
jgi:hypothetical protein